jgi:hypothetical protein
VEPPGHGGILRRQAEGVQRAAITLAQRVLDKVLLVI